jgi:putative peptidoglycan lipid II flippase
MATAPPVEPPPLETPASTPPPQSQSRRIANATAIMMVAILASRLLGLVRNSIISHHLGQSFDADVYSGAFRIPDLLFYLIAGGALSSAFIPIFTEHITKGEEEKAWHIFSTVFTVMFVVVSAFVIAGEIFAAPLVRLVNPGFSAAKIAAIVPLTRIVLPAQICFFMGGILMGSQQSRNKFLIPALGPIIYNVGIIFGGVVLYRWLGLPGFCWGALGGAVLGNFGLQWWAVKRSGMRFKPSFNARHPNVMKVWKLMLPVILGVALPQVSIWINGAFASQLRDGSMAALTYANTLMQVPLGIFAQAMAVAIFPTLAALAAEKRFSDLRSTSSGGIRSLLFLTIPSSAFMAVLAVPVVQLLFQQGKFTPSDTVIAASALSYYCIGIFAWSAQSILSRTFYALQDTKTPVIVGTGVTLVFIPLNILFMRTLGMGVQGLAFATSVAATLHMVVMLAILRLRLKGFETGKLLVSIGKTVLASAVAGAVCWGVTRMLVISSGTGHVKVHALLSILLGFGTGAVVYVAVAVGLKMEELQQAGRMLRRKRKTPPATPA